MPYGNGRGGRPWRRLREQVMKRDGYMCQCEDCKGEKLIAHEVDHISNARDADGNLNDAPSNLRAMNRDCHALKTKREANPGFRERVDVGVDGWPI
jgi:5-methylcytosine-specific restriction protein A